MFISILNSFISGRKIALYKSTQTPFQRIGLLFSANQAHGSSLKSGTLFTSGNSEAVFQCCRGPVSRNDDDIPDTLCGGKIEITTDNLWRHVYIFGFNGLLAGHLQCYPGTGREVSAENFETDGSIPTSRIRRKTADFRRGRGGRGDVRALRQSGSKYPLLVNRRNKNR